MRTAHTYGLPCRGCNVQLYNINFKSEKTGRTELYPNWKEMTPCEIQRLNPSPSNPRPCCQGSISVFRWFQGGQPMQSTRNDPAIWEWLTKACQWTPEIGHSEHNPPIVGVNNSERACVHTEESCFCWILKTRSCITPFTG